MNNNSEKQIDEGALLPAGLITMTTESDNVKFYLTGTGEATVDWGDGSEKMTRTLDENDTEKFERKYLDKLMRTIYVI